MRKTIFSIMAGALLVVGLAACGGSSTIKNYCDDLEDLRTLDRDKARDKMEKIETSTVGKEVPMEIDGSAPFKVVNNFSVVRVTPIYGGMDFEGQIQVDDSDVDVRDYCLVACDGSKPLKELPYTTYPFDGVNILEFHLNVGNLVHGGEKAKDEIRNIDRIVITKKDSDLMKELLDANK